MTHSRFFQLALFFPAALWCLCLLAFSLIYKQGGGFIFNNMYNAYRVFVPYFIFSAYVWNKATGRSYRELLCMASVLPMIWGVFFTLFFIAVSYAVERTIEKCHILAIMAFWATLVAYLLELIPFLILVVFKDDFRSRTVEETE